MAKLTTDKYNVKIAFGNAREKAMHLFRNGWIISDPEQVELKHIDTDNLSDTFVMKRVYPTDQDKFDSFFHKGSHTKQYSAKLIRSTTTGDEFDVEVDYAGSQKDFDAVFNLKINAKLAVVETTRESSKTKNLGTKHARVAGDDIKIIQAYIEEVLDKTTLDKNKTVPKSKDFFKYKTTVISPNKYFYYDEKLSIVCVHLHNFKVGIIPDKESMDHISIMVHAFNDQTRSSNQHFPILSIKSQENFKSLKIISDHDREKAIKDYGIMNDWARRRKRITMHDLYGQNHENVAKFNLSDPDLFEKLVAFFEELKTVTYCCNE